MIDAALCGYEYSGLPKLLNVADHPRLYATRAVIERAQHGREGHQVHKVNQRADYLRLLTPVSRNSRRLRHASTPAAASALGVPP